eukprot:6186831-Pleurochrysis_carterae.AAC.2
MSRFCRSGCGMHSASNLAHLDVRENGRFQSLGRLTSLVLRQLAQYLARRALRPEKRRSVSIPAPDAAGEQGPPLPPGRSTTSVAGRPGMLLASYTTGIPTVT